MIQILLAIAICGGAGERQHIVGLFIQDGLCDIALTAHHVQRGDGAFEHEHCQQFRNGRDFVGFLIHLGLSQYQALASRKGRDGVKTDLPPLLAQREVLPSMATTPSEIPVNAATHAAKHCTIITMSCRLCSSLLRVWRCGSERPEK